MYADCWQLPKYVSKKKKTSQHQSIRESASTSFLKKRRSQMCSLTLYKTFLKKKVIPVVTYHWHTSIFCAAGINLSTPATGVAARPKVWLALRCTKKLAINIYIFFFFPFNKKWSFPYENRQSTVRHTATMMNSWMLHIFRNHAQLWNNLTACALTCTCCGPVYFKSLSLTKLSSLFMKRSSRVAYITD